MELKNHQKYTVNLKKEKEAIAIAYRRVSNKYNTLQRTYVKDWDILFFIRTPLW